MPHALQRSMRLAAVKFPNDDADLRQVSAIATDGTTDRMGDIVEPSGGRLENYRKNPVVLAQHDASQPIARCISVTAYPTQITALIEFPAIGVNALSDQYLNLIRANVLSALSIGFMPISRQPLKEGGWRYTDWELYELSVVSVPANPSALVTERALRRQTSRGYGTPPAPCPALPIFDPTNIAEARAFLNALREKHDLRPAVDPRLIAAEAQFRCLRW